MTDKQTIDYLNSLKEGERVVEINNTCMRGRRGTVYHKNGYPCVLWDAEPGEKGRMGTSATWGTRRITDVGYGQASQ